MTNFAELLPQAGIGGTPSLCQDAMIELLNELFADKKYHGQTGYKKLKIFKQDLPIPEDNDDDVDTDMAAAPYIIVQMTGGEISGDDNAQTMEMSLIICSFDEDIHRDGAQDVQNIKERIIQRICQAPYFGGIFTVLKPIAWSTQIDDTAPYYFGAVLLTCTAPAMSQDTALGDLV